MLKTTLYSFPSLLLFIFLFGHELLNPKSLQAQPRSSTDSLIPIPGIDILILPSLEFVGLSSIRASEQLPITQTNWNSEIIDKNYQSQEIPLLLQRTPSIFAYSDAGSGQGYAYLRMRGLDPTRINFTLNGVPLNEPEDQGAYFSNFADFANSLQSLQIQRGVGSSTNGVAAYAGSINFESISPSRLNQPRGQFQTSFGSFNTYRVGAEYNSGRQPNGFGLYSRISVLGSDGYREHSGNRSLSAFLSGGYFGGSQVLKFTGFLGNSRNQMAYLATNLSDLQQNPRTNYLSRDENDDFTQYFAHAQWLRYFGSRKTLNANLYYTGINGNYDLATGPDIFNLALQSHAIGFFGNWRQELLARRLILQTGVLANYYRRYHRFSQKPYISQLFYDNYGEKPEASAFVKAEYHLKNFTFLLDLQGRWTQFRYQPDADYGLSPIAKNWLFLNPKLGLSYQLDNTNEQQQLLYFSAGLAHREPTRTDLLGAYDDIDSSNLSQVGDFSRVKPEQVLDLELGYRLTAAKISLQANAFGMFFRNEIAAIGQLNFFGIPLRKNVERSLRAGLELQLWAFCFATNIEFNCF
jgi:iron complex outermembrane receptor protein